MTAANAVHLTPLTPTRLLDMVVADVLDACPATAHVFIERRMGCVGCAFARFETVRDTARAYGFEPEELANSLAATLPR